MARLSAVSANDTPSASTYLSDSPFAYVTTSGDLAIDGISGPTKWGTVQGGPATVTYSFGETGSSWIEGYAEPRTGYLPLSQGQREAVRSALDAWATVGGIRFVEVKETGEAQGDIRFAVSGIPETADARYPGEYTSAGDVWLGSTDHRPNSDLAAERAKYAPGGYAYYVIVHEIGHAIGAKHPHETLGRNTVLPPEDDWRGASVMSYRDAPSDPVQSGASASIYPTAPMELDVDWIRSVYGNSANSNRGDTVYRWDRGEAILETIVDDGGADRLDWSNQKSAVEFDLRGGWQKAGPVYRWDKGSRDTTLFLHGEDAIEDAFGGSGNDQIRGNAKANHLAGNDGDDLLAGRGGDDLLEGGTGNDRYLVEKNPGSDRIVDIGGSGDRIEFAAGFLFADLLFTTSANDLRIQSSNAKAPLDLLLVDQLLSAGIDELRFADDSIQRWNGSSFGSGTGGGSGTGSGTGGGTPSPDANAPSELADFLILTDGNDRVATLGGNDVVFAKGGNDWVDGGNGNDWLIGGAGLDELIGADGDDKLDGGDGNDQLFGGAGNDVLRGGGGADILQAGDGADIAYGAVGDDTIFGGEGDDLQLVGGVGNDTVYGGAGRDSLDGASGDDILDGGDGNDLMVGGAGNDQLGGAGGDDVLRGGFGNDRLMGGAGNDELNGGFGNDVLVGGPGQDTAIFNGTIAQYRFTDMGGGVTEVRHLPANGIWYGADLLSEIELVKFGNAAPIPFG
ncbi:M10 family metallopeptidase [Geminicoccus roseus]|uniref:M10 family metallopeptidase n=1 Tax=Geminicoccus roseus TaxID=404900 RepID=UPI0004067017|nr:M10 family metallopeptidase [Geminicoccus roseus]